MNERDNQYHNNDEISLKDLILRIQEFWRELWRNWWLIALICIPFVGYFAFKAFKAPDKFTPEIKFIVEGQDGASFGGLGGLLGSFGFGRSGGGNINPYKIAEVAKSKELMNEVIFVKSPDGKYVANELIEVYEMNEGWSKDLPEMQNFRFGHDSIENFTVIENIALRSIFDKVLPNKKGTNNPLVTLVFNEETGTFSIAASTIDENISFLLLNTTYDKLKFFFEEKILDEKITTRDLLKSKTDSLQGLINSKINSLAKFEDTNRGLISKRAQINKAQLQSEIKGLTTAYAESIRNYEIADYSYRNSKPLFLKIDYSLSPLRAESQSVLRGVIIGGLVGGLLACFWVFVRYSYKNIMNS